MVQGSETQSCTGAQLRSFITEGAQTVVPISIAAPGNFAVAHGLGAVPSAAIIQMTSAGSIWLQTPTSFDATNLYLVSSGGFIGSPLTATAVVFS